MKPVKPQFDWHKKPQLKLPSVMHLVTTTSIGLVVGYLGPFGSFQMPLVDRLVYWVILIAVGDFIFSQSDWLSQRLLGKWRHNRFLSFVTSTVLGAVVLTFFVAYITAWMIGAQLPFPHNFVFYFPKVLILALALNVIGNLLNQYHESAEQTHKPEPQATEHMASTFMARLPKALGDDLICFSMEDHYLRVHTTAGSDLILLRMKDALVELKDFPGLQVHRSWWVALAAVVEVKKQGRKVTLRMRNDLEVPVSKTHLPALKAAGLL